MIRYKEFMLTFLCSALLLTSCGQDEIPVGTKDSEPLTFKLHLSGNGNPTTRAVDAPFYEDVNIPVYLYAYEITEGKTTADDDAIPFIFMKDAITNGEDVTFTYWPKNDQMRSGRYDIYAIGYDGKSSSGIVLDKDVTKGDLLALTQNGTDLNSTDKMYMLSGGIMSTDFYHADKTITLIRNVCRLSLNITDNTPGQVLTKITATFESFDKTYVFNSTMRGSTDIPIGAVSMDYKMEISHNNHVFNDSIYFFEKKPSTTYMHESEKVLVSIVAEDGTNSPLNYQFWLNKDEGYITCRNTIYRVNASLTAERIILEQTQIPWGDGGTTTIPPLTPVP